MSYKPYTKYSTAKSFFVSLINQQIKIGTVDKSLYDIMLEYAKINLNDNLTAARFLIDNYTMIMQSNAEVRVGT